MLSAADWPNHGTHNSEFRRYDLAVGSKYLNFIAVLNRPPPGSGVAKTSSRALWILERHIGGQTACNIGASVCCISMLWECWLHGPQLALLDCSTPGRNKVHYCDMMHVRDNRRWWSALVMDFWPSLRIAELNGMPQCQVKRIDAAKYKSPVWCRPTAAPKALFEMRDTGRSGARTTHATVQLELNRTNHSRG